MIKLALRLAVLLVINGLIILFLNHLVEGFRFSGGLKELAVAAAALTGLNALVRPVLKVLFSPILIITLGVFIVVINALCLYLLDILIAGVTIEGLFPLLYAALLVTLVNVFLHFFKKPFK